MRSFWAVFPLAILVCGVASAADQVSCHKMGRETVVTATEGSTTYAVNGSARDMAASMGWKDGKDHYEPSELQSLLKRGLMTCSAAGPDTIARPKAIEPSAQGGTPAQSAALPYKGKMTADAFIKAANSGDLDTIKQYVAAGFKVNTPGPGVPSLGIKGSPAIQTASAAKQCAIVDYLLSVGAKPDPKELKYGSTPVGSAAQAGATDCVRSLIAKGARVDVADEPGGDTPLIKAAYQGHLDVVRLLVEHGANLKATNKDGDTPYRAAVSMGNNQVAQYLKSKGGK